MVNKTDSSNELREFAEGLKKAVEKTGLTPYALALKVGLDKQAISNLIRGDRDPKFSTVIRIAKNTGLSLDRIIKNPPCQECGNSPPKKAEIEKKEKAISNDKFSKMHPQDVELLEAIARLLIERRTRMMAKFINAVRNPGKLDKKEKDGLMAKAEISRMGRSSADDDLEDDADFDDEDDFYDYDDLEGDFKDDDDLEEEDDDFDEDDDFLYEP